MLEWLAGWLRAVIAVVLLAGLVELLLPGKAMQRYARLVIGLLVLLTLMSPLLKLFGADTGKLLEEGLRRWEASRPSGMPEMPGLEQIRQEADRLRVLQERQAGAFAERQLASVMAAEAEAVSGLQVAGLDVELDSEGGTVKSVEVRLDAGLSKFSPERSAEGEAEGKGTAPSPVEPVDIGVIDLTSEGGSEAGGAAEAATDAGVAGEWRPADSAAARAVRSALAAKWAFEPEKVTVFERAPAAVPAGSQAN